MNKNLLLLMPLMTVLFLVACEDDDSAEPDDVEVEANFSFSPENPSPGQEILLDASASSVDGAEDVNYSWSINVPDESEAELDSESGETTSFTADLAGDYEVVLEVSSNGSEDATSREISVTNEEEISGDLEEAQTLHSDVTYTVTSCIDIQADITIEPGTVILFEEEACFNVRSGGSLNAEGTSEDSIYFTGTSQMPGWWRGIQYTGSASLNNILEYVVIEYSGNDRDAALMLDATTSGDGSETDLRNSVLRNNDAGGLYIGRNSEVRDASENTYTGNDFPVDARAYNVHTLNGNSTFTGNEDDAVMVRGGDIEDEDVIWDALDVHYQLSGNTDVSGVILEIMDGADLKFEEEAGLVIRSGSALNAEGTNENKITFGATQELPGWWNGIHFFGSSSQNNVLNHVIIEYAGNEHDFAGNDRNEALILNASNSGGGSATDFLNSTIRHSDGYGLYMGEKSEIRNASRNEYTGNEVPVYARSYNVHNLHVSSEFTGNNEDYVYVSGREVSDEDVTWQALEVPYRMSGETEINNIELTINEGAEFHFEEEGSFRSTNYATVKAIGSDDNPVIFTGSQQSPGWWQGIWLRTNSVNNQFEHVVVEYAGSDREGAVKVGAPSSVISGADLDLRNSEIQNNESYGVWVSDDSDVNQDICTANTFDNNSSGDCEFE